MHQKRRITFLIFVLASIAFIPLLAESPTHTPLWPAIQPYKTGYMQVSNLHQIYYQLGGNPKGKPVMVLHGGPGAGCSPYYFRYFNPEKFHIILHDQRGSRNSKPFAEIKENTTQLLVEDIEKLRKHFNLGKVILFGGSWGSTLALAYAETYPQNVSGIILRGVFTATQSEIDHFFHGGTALYFPKEYETLVSLMDEPAKKNYPSQFLKKLLSPVPAVRKKYAKAWAAYETKLASIEISDAEVENIFNHFDPYAFSLLENYYMANNCFLKEGQLFENLGKISHIPVYIINGRYDVICPPITAYKLYKKLPKSTLIIGEKSGHGGSEASNLGALLDAVRKFE